MESRRWRRSARIDEAATDSAGGGGSEAKETMVAAAPAEGAGSLRPRAECSYRAHRGDTGKWLSLHDEQTSLSPSRCGTC